MKREREKDDTLNLFQDVGGDGGKGGGYASMITISVHRERQKNGFVHEHVCKQMV
jgi:hypothetical protein